MSDRDEEDEIIIGQEKEDEDEEDDLSDPSLIITTTISTNQRRSSKHDKKKEHRKRKMETAVWPLLPALDYDDQDDKQPKVKDNKRDRQRHHERIQLSVEVDELGSKIKNNHDTDSLFWTKNNKR